MRGRWGSKMGGVSCFLENWGILRGEGVGCVFIGMVCRGLRRHGVDGSGDTSLLREYIRDDDGRLI